MKKILISIISIILIFTLVGCSSSKISKKKIIEDLNLTDNAILWNDNTFDITDCEIANETENGENGLIYDCSITKKNEKYEIIAQCSVEYIKGNDGWSLLNYTENEIDVTPISGVNDDIIIKHIETKYANRENTTVTNITHDFSQENKTDYITAEYKCEQPYYSKNGQVTINATFKNNEWNLSDSTDNSNGEWKLQPLVGTWQFERGNHLVQYKILSIDEASSKVSYQIRSTTNGTFWGDGSQRINDKQFSEIMQGTFVKTSKMKEEHIMICSATIYHNHFDFDYGLYVDKDSVYSYDDFYNKTYTAISVDKPSGTSVENEHSQTSSVVIPDWYIENGVAVKGNQLCFSRNDGLIMDEGVEPTTVRVYTANNDNKITDVTEYIIFDNEAQAKKYSAELNTYEGGTNSFGMKKGQSSYSYKNNIMIETVDKSYYQAEEKIYTLDDAVNWYSNNGWNINYLD